jgi:Signal transduction histidine kinase, nitrate/nitrite-specific
VLKSIVDQNRNMRTSSWWTPGAIWRPPPWTPAGMNIADRDYFRSALTARGFATGEYIVSRTTGEPSFPFTQALLDADGNVSGVLVASLRLSSYAPLAHKLRLPPNSMLGIVDRAGRRLYRYPAQADSPLGGVIKPENMAAITAGPDADILFLSDQDDLPRLYAYKKLRLAPRDDPYMTLVLGMPESPLAAVARSALARNVTLLVLVTVLTLFWAWFLAETVLGGRLQAITSAAARIREGDLSARTGLPPDSSDIGEVAHALDRMAESLQQRELERVETAETMIPLPARKGNPPARDPSPGQEQPPAHPLPGAAPGHA